MVSVSADIEALLGFKAEDFVGGKVDLLQRFHADDQDIVTELCSRQVSPEPVSFNARLRQANGRIRWVKGPFTKTPDAAGTGIMLNLRLQDAKSLWQHKATPLSPEFRAMMESTEDFIFFKDRNHVFTGASQTLVAITDPSEHWSDLLGLTDYDVFPEAYADIYHRLEKQVFGGQDVAHEIQQMQDTRGRKGWVDNRKYPIRDESGVITGLFGIARDITQTQLAQEALRESESALRESQLIAGLGSYVLDVCSGIWSSSDVLDLVFGIDASYDHFVAGWEALIHPDERAMVHDFLLHEVLGRGQVFHKEYRIVRHCDQAVRWVRGLGRLDFDAAGQAYESALASCAELAMDNVVQSTQEYVRKDGRRIWVAKSAALLDPERAEFLWTVIDITERKAAEEKIQHLAFYDPLTQLPNRRLLGDRLKQTLAASRRSELCGALRFIDMDNFKPLNDAHGHGVGDLLLPQVATRLHACVREVDTVARVGGDEFVVLLGEVDIDQGEATEQALRVAEKVRQTLAEPYRLELVRQDDTAADVVQHECSASIGVVVFTNDEASQDEILKRADDTMYHAKAAERNSIRVYAASQLSA